jgi:hypothetical protein
MAKLVLFLEDGATRDIALGKERITIGRRADNDVCLPHPAVSGEHAAIVTILNDSFLEDLGSTNGTLVNGEPIQKHFLRDGDLIDVGRQRLVYLADDHAQPDARQHYAMRGAFSGDTFNGGTNSATPSGPTHWDRRTDSRVTGSSAPEARRQPRSAMSADTVSGAQSSAAAVSRVVAAHLDADQPPQLIVLSGPSAGRTLALTKDVISVGRAGVQVALVRRTPRGYTVGAGEGSTPPLVNGALVDGAGTLLAPGDVIEVAGARIEFSAPPDLPT